MPEVNVERNSLVVLPHLKREVVVACQGLNSVVYCFVYHTHSEPLGGLGGKHVEDVKQLCGYSGKCFVLMQIKAGVSDVKLEERAVKLGISVL